MPTELKTDPALIERLRRSGKHVTREQLHRQRVSVIAGGLPMESTITHRQIETVLADHDGTSAAA